MRKAAGIGMGGEGRKRGEGRRELLVVEYSLKGT